MEIIFDIEADGFLYDATRIHVISMVMIPDPSGASRRSYMQLGDDDTHIREAIDLLNEATVLVGHNIMGYDIPLIDKLYPGKLNLKGKKIFDTFLASSLVYPNRSKHSLEFWADHMAMHVRKVEYTGDWKEFDPLMVKRCQADVEINERVYILLKSTWIGKADMVMQLECQVARIQARQELRGVHFFRDRAEALYLDIVKEAESLRAEITAGIPPVFKHVTTVTHPYKRDGCLTERANKYLEGHAGVPPSAVGPFSVLKMEEFNLDSAPQVAKFLLSQGWKPTQWNFVKDKATGRLIKSSPKLTDESWDSLPAGLGEKIGRYKMLQHRARLIYNSDTSGEEKGAISTIRSDGRIPAEALTCATPTSRYRHMKTICNLPRPSSPLGTEVRSLFGVPDGSIMIGADLSSIEARMMCHYSLPYRDGEKLKDIVLHDDFHRYNAHIWDCSRNAAKTGLYALMYGCGEAKLASSLGKPKGSGGKYFKKFWDGAPALKELIDQIEAAMESGRDLHGLDGRILSIREKRKGLNTLLQGGAAIVFKLWMVLIDRWIEQEGLRDRVHQIIAYHDELQFEVVGDFEFATDVAAKINRLAGRAGEILKIRVPIESDCKIGHNWAETH